ncbi:MAG: hypothetical protein KBB52_06815 [Candidatus Omnitrophica bacterium]|nr:hypothetical protein [Candidatus Omnitrophota bacterium]
MLGILFSLEKKIDLLIQKSPDRPIADNKQSAPFHQRFDGNALLQKPRQEGPYRDRILYKAICADCNKSCEVPFKPSGDRPVYCKECFSTRKNKNIFNAKGNAKPIQPPISHAKPVEKATLSEKPKAAKKKKTKSRGRK